MDGIFTFEEREGFEKVSSALRARSLARRRVSFYAMLRVERWKTAKRKTSRKRNTKREVGGNCRWQRVMVNKLGYGQNDAMSDFFSSFVLFVPVTL